MASSLLLCLFLPVIHLSVSWFLSVFVFLPSQSLSSFPSQLYDAFELLICESLCFLSLLFTCICLMCLFAAPRGSTTNLNDISHMFSPTTSLFFSSDFFFCQSILSGWRTVGKKNRGSRGKESIYIIIILFVPSLTPLLSLSKQKQTLPWPSAHSRGSELKAINLAPSQKGTLASVIGAYCKRCSTNEVS